MGCKDGGIPESYQPQSNEAPLPRKALSDQGNKRMTATRGDLGHSKPTTACQGVLTLHGSVPTPPLPFLVVPCRSYPGCDVPQKDGVPRASIPDTMCLFSGWVASVVSRRLASGLETSVALQATHLNSPTSISGCPRPGFLNSEASILVRPLLLCRSQRFR